ncbi:MAG TPA: hypothetical protein VJV05_03570, partial [Pyrinomonadaceae bacterium]|nr:hypothetical protein [Pyrinomonadaceae bacterium]
MKRCPECRRDYYDDSLHYCLDDGTELLEGPASDARASEPATAVLPTVAIPSERPTLQHVDTEAKRSVSWSKWTAALLLGLGFVAAAYWFLIRRDVAQIPPPQPKLTQITFADGVEEYPAWSSDGIRVAYSGEVGNVRKIFIKQIDSGDERQLTLGDTDDIQAVWSPDGSTILFVRAQKPNQKLQPTDVFGTFEGGDIWSVDVQSGTEAKIVEDAFNPAFSPDGKSIAYDASRSGPRRIWTSNSGGYNPQQISTDVSEEASHVRPRWSSDGKRIVFQNIERTKFNIRTVEVAGRNMTWITNDLYNNLNPVWSYKNN